MVRLETEFGFAPRARRTSRSRRQLGEKQSGGGQGLLRVRRERRAGGNARLPGVVAILDPVHADRRREAVRGDVLGRAEGIARALEDQCGRAESREMLRPEAVRLAGRMERVSEAEERSRAELVRHEAGDPPAERLAADREALASLEPFERASPALPQDRLAVRGTAAAAAPPRAHVRKLEARDADPASP